MIYTDGVHIISDQSVAELRAFMRKVGIKDCWYHPSRNHPHYDKPKRFPLLKLQSAGARLAKTRTLVRICDMVYDKRGQ